jgi:hypothetical protein
MPSAPIKIVSTTTPQKPRPHGGRRCLFRLAKRQLYLINPLATARDDEV